jgi:hypothetical protein
MYTSIARILPHIVTILKQKHVQNLCPLFFEMFSNSFLFIIVNLFQFMSIVKRYYTMPAVLNDTSIEIYLHLFQPKHRCEINRTGILATVVYTL